jgi:hypothetical protein
MRSDDAAKARLVSVRYGKRQHIEMDKTTVPNMCTPYSMSWVTIMRIWDAIIMMDYGLRRGDWDISGLDHNS